MKTRSFKSRFKKKRPQKQKIDFNSIDPTIFNQVSKSYLYFSLLVLSCPTGETDPFHRTLLDGYQRFKESGGDGHFAAALEQNQDAQNASESE